MAKKMGRPRVGTALVQFRAHPDLIGFHKKSCAEEGTTLSRRIRELLERDKAERLK